MHARPASCAPFMRHAQLHARAAHTAARTRVRRPPARRPVAALRGAHAALRHTALLGPAGPGGVKPRGPAAAYLGSMASACVYIFSAAAKSCRVTSESRLIHVSRRDGHGAHTDRRRRGRETL
jgi:hypothetical protein